MDRLASCDFAERATLENGTGRTDHGFVVAGPETRSGTEGERPKLRRNRAKPRAFARFGPGAKRAESASSPNIFKIAAAISAYAALAAAVPAHVRSSTLRALLAAALPPRRCDCYPEMFRLRCVPSLELSTVSHRRRDRALQVLDGRQGLTGPVARSRRCRHAGFDLPGDVDGAEQDDPTCAGLR
jgi:hypothetical protein